MHPANAMMKMTAPRTMMRIVRSNTTSNTFAYLGAPFEELEVNLLFSANAHAPTTTNVTPAHYSMTRNQKFIMLFYVHSKLSSLLETKGNGFIENNF